MLSMFGFALDGCFGGKKCHFRGGDFRVGCDDGVWDGS